VAAVQQALWELVELAALQTTTDQTEVAAVAAVQIMVVLAQRQTQLLLLLVAMAEQVVVELVSEVMETRQQTLLGQLTALAELLQAAP